eukprot:CAMPEP_0180043546 /NCGR_PEP_ID=MMETSP0984-20121128/35407_1 /TAXON_ID=483367 /ORGANISM="non described non described, Strain CCMP 2436" /LENGTH=101 /DNA_ID=CAMNT_0021971573 /DNA_START=66 /DNA_END=367 /DNA_ORIENTATION=+
MARVKLAVLLLELRLATADCVELAMLVQVQRLVGFIAPTTPTTLLHLLSPPGHRSSSAGCVGDGASPGLLAEPAQPVQPVQPGFEADGEWDLSSYLGKIET